MGYHRMAVERILQMIRKEKLPPRFWLRPQSNSPLPTRSGKSRVLFLPCRAPGV